MDHNSPLVSTKDEIVQFLKGRQELSYVDIRESYIKADTDLPLKKPLLTVERGKWTTKTISFGNYLGEKLREVLEGMTIQQINETSIGELENTVFSEFVETKGKQLNIYFDLHIWNGTSPKLGGEKEIDRIIDKLMAIVEFESNALDGITFVEFEEGTTMEDPEEDDLFHSRCRLQVQVLWKKEYIYEVISDYMVFGEIEE